MLVWFARKRGEEGGGKWVLTLSVTSSVTREINIDRWLQMFWPDWLLCFSRVIKFIEPEIFCCFSPVFSGCVFLCVDILLDSGVNFRLTLPLMMALSLGQQFPVVLQQVNSKCPITFIQVDLCFFFFLKKKHIGWALTVLFVIHDNVRYIRSFGIERWGVRLPRKRCSEGV